MEVLPISLHLRPPKAFQENVVSWTKFPSRTKIEKNKCVADTLVLVVKVLKVTAVVAEVLPGGKLMVKE